ncbi:MAG: sulfur reduction protein DsrE [Deltaproteobacteria bacterium]|nr:MAG: sulfur reduction protein DsrE [Deltaproteobacteria bacterium]
MTNNVVIIISCGTDNTNRSTRGLHLAKVAHEEGKNVSIFLLDEAVYLAKEGIITHVKAATGDSADDLLAYLQVHEVPFIACKPCAEARQITEKDLTEGARFGTGVELVRLISDAAVISL